MSFSRTLPVVITLLALADGLLHISLDIVLFRGNFFGSFGPPPGAAPPPPGARPGPPIPLPLPLNQMFVLNFVGYVLLVTLFWLLFRRLGGWRWWMDAAFLVYVAGAFLAWVDFGMPNPMGLGYLSKSVEVLLILTLVAHLWQVRPRPRPRARNLNRSVS